MKSQTGQQHGRPTTSESLCGTSITAQGRKAVAPASVQA